jgi:hypothetical protein
VRQDLLQRSRVGPHLWIPAVACPSRSITYRETNVTALQAASRRLIGIYELQLHKYIIRIFISNNYCQDITFGLVSPISKGCETLADFNCTRVQDGSLMKSYAFVFASESER